MFDKENQQIYQLSKANLKKSLIRETKNLSTDPDSSPNTKFFLLVRQNLPKNPLFLCGNFTPFMSKSFQIRDHFFSLLFPKDSKN